MAQLTVVISLLPNDLVSRACLFNLRQGQFDSLIFMLQDSVNYLFDLTTSCPTNIFESGSSIMFDVIVTTERNVTGGPMEIVAPIPSSSTASNLKFCGAKVKNIGKNVICAQEGDVQPTLTSW